MVTIDDKKKVLEKIAHVFNENGILWALGASMLLYFKGIAKEFHDIDLMVAEGDAEKAKGLLSELGRINPPNPNPKYGTKHFMEFVIDDVDIDVMAGFSIHSEGKNVDCSLKKEQVAEHTKLGEEEIPMQSVSLWLGYYRLMGRADKVRMIESSIDIISPISQKETNHMDTSKAMEILNGSLIYQMSLGSKELFHSNIWGYLINRDSGFIHAFIEPQNINLAEYVSVKAYREYHHRDIVIFLERKDGEKELIVIENKIKSLPTVNQLEDYTGDLDGYQFKAGILTGIGESTIDFQSSEKLNGKWSFASYADISRRLLEIALKSDSDNVKLHISEIREYCQVVDAIGCSLSHYLSLSKDRLSYECKDEFGDLYDLRIADVFKKFRGSDFLHYVRIRDKEEGSITPICPEGYEVVINQGFHNGKVTLDVRLSNWKDADSKYQLLGIQIEGNQFRIVAERNLKFEEGKSADWLYEQYKDSWFDDSYDKFVNRSVLGKKTAMKPRNGKKYDSYQTGSYCFVYQYFDIGGESGVDDSYEALYSLIKEYISKAARLLKQY